MIFVSKMRGFGLVVSEVNTIWIKLYGHSANVPHVLGNSVDSVPVGGREGLISVYILHVRV